MANEHLISRIRACIHRAVEAGHIPEHWDCGRGFRKAFEGQGLVVVSITHRKETGKSIDMLAAKKGTIGGLNYLMDADEDNLIGILRDVNGKKLGEVIAETTPAGLEESV